MFLDLFRDGDFFVRICTIGKSPFLKTTNLGDFVFLLFLQASKIQIQVFEDKPNLKNHHGFCCSFSRLVFYWRVNLDLGMMNDDDVLFMVKKPKSTRTSWNYRVVLEKYGLESEVGGGLLFSFVEGSDNHKKPT